MQTRAMTTKNNNKKSTAPKPPPIVTADALDYDTSFQYVNILDIYFSQDTVTKDINEFRTTMNVRCAKNDPIRFVLHENNIYVVGFWGKEKKPKPENEVGLTYPLIEVVNYYKERPYIVITNRRLFTVYAKLYSIASNDCNLQDPTLSLNITRKYIVDVVSKIKEYFSYVGINVHNIFIPVIMYRSTASRSRGETYGDFIRERLETQTSFCRTKVDYDTRIRCSEINQFIYGSPIIPFPSEEVIKKDRQMYAPADGLNYEPSYTKLNPNPIINCIGYGSYNKQLSIAIGIPGSVTFLFNNIRHLMVSTIKGENHPINKILANKSKCNKELHDLYSPDKRYYNDDFGYMIRTIHRYPEREDMYENNIQSLIDQEIAKERAEIAIERNERPKTRAPPLTSIPYPLSTSMPIPPPDPLSMPIPIPLPDDGWTTIPTSNHNKIELIPPPVPIPTVTEPTQDKLDKTLIKKYEDKEKVIENHILLKNKYESELDDLRKTPLNTYTQQKINEHKKKIEKAQNKISNENRIITDAQKYIDDTKSQYMEAKDRNPRIPKGGFSRKRKHKNKSIKRNRK